MASEWSKIDYLEFIQQRTEIISHQHAQPLQEKINSPLRKFGHSDFDDLDWEQEDFGEKFEVTDGFVVTS